MVTKRNSYDFNASTKSKKINPLNNESKDKKSIKTKKPP